MWLTENYPPDAGGMAQSCDRIVRSLRELGIVVDVAHFSRRGTGRIERKRQGRYLACPVREDPAHAMNCLWNLLSHPEADVPYSHVVAFGGVLPLQAGPVYASWLSAPLLTLLRGNDFDTGIFSLKRADGLRFALERSAGICAVGQDGVRKLDALYPQSRVHWTPNGIDLSLWRITETDTERGRLWRGENVTGRRIVLGLFGQLKQKKGGLFFLEALLHSGRADLFHLLLVGEMEPEMAGWLAAHVGEIATSIHPFQERYDLIPYMAACDLIVVPSFYDGMPNVLLEGAALSVPFLASTAGGIPDVLEDGEHAFLFHPGDANGCRRAIERAAAASPDDLKRMGANCRRRIEVDFNHHKEAERYRTILLDTMKMDEPPQANPDP